MSAPMTLLELKDAIAKAIADAVGHGMREKCEQQADAVLAVVGPQLLATANHLLPSGEQGGAESETKVNMHATLAMQDAGTEILWNKQFKGSPWEGQFNLINRASLGELNKVACDVYFAMRGVELDTAHPPAQAARVGSWTEVNAVADEMGKDGGRLHDKWAMRLTAAMPTAYPSAQVAQVADAFRRGYDQAKLEESINADLQAAPAPTAEPVAQGEAVAYLHTVVQDDGEQDHALSFSSESFPLQGVGGFRSIACRPLALAARAVPDDTKRLDLLQREIVDTIYMDDGRIIDVQGLDLRKSIDEFAAAPQPGESA